MGKNADRVAIAGEKLIDRAMRRLVIRLYQGLTSASPVDTGFFRGRWVPILGRADRSFTIDRPADRVVAKATGARLFAKHQALALAFSKSYRANQGPLSIVNSTSYAIFLDQGTSSQAPAQFVERETRRAVRATQRELG